MWYLYIVYFFFFKQKTAYEMRISDWSSDVCSSDLFVEQADEDADDDREIEDRDCDAGDDPELFADHGEDIVGVRLRQLELGESGARAGADQAARGQRRVCLVDLVAVAAFEQPDVDALLRDRIDRKSTRLNSHH